MSDDVFWAAFGGGAAAGLFTLFAVAFAEWLRWFLNRPLIKTELKFVQMVGGIPRDETNYLSYGASNIHDKAVTLKSYGLVYRKNPSLVLHTIPSRDGLFPCRLQGRESVSDYIPEENLFVTLKKRKESPKDLKWVYFQEASGKFYRNKIP